ncbi:glycoside hydrolase superfamily [Aspergillus recurvatus]
MLLGSFTLSVLALSPGVRATKLMMYLTGQHNVVPELSLVSDVTHVALAFMQSSTFNRNSTSSDWPLFTTVNAVRPKFSEGTSILISIGGWGDTQGFSESARTAESRKLFADNIRQMVDDTGADGVDIDWEYPGGNGEDYKQTPNSEKTWEIAAYPQLLAEIRAAIPDKLITAAVPGLPRDMLAFTKETIPSISASIDFLNVMTYDLMNRRDNVTKHHTGLQLSLESIDAYLEAGMPPEKLNLGLAYYVKWFKTVSGEQCAKEPIGCPTVLMEDPDTGADLGQAGAFSWNDPVPKELAASFAKAKSGGEYDTVGGGYYFWDSEESIFWSWDTADAIGRKFPAVVEEKKLGGVFAWGLGEDAPDFAHLKATVAGLRDYSAGPGGKLCTTSGKDEL